jgi:restriction endonuclease S subunit
MQNFSQIPATIPQRLEDQKRIANLLDTLDQNTATQEATLAQLTRTKTAISNAIFSQT